MQIDMTPRHPMRCSPVDEPSINAAGLIVVTAPPPELRVAMLKLAGQIRRGEVVDGAYIVALLRNAADYFPD